MHIYICTDCSCIVYDYKNVVGICLHICIHMHMCLNIYIQYMYMYSICVYMLYNMFSSHIYVHVYTAMCMHNITCLCYVTLYVPLSHIICMYRSRLQSFRFHFVDIQSFSVWAFQCPTFIVQMVKFLNISKLNQKPNCQTNLKGLNCNTNLGPWGPDGSRWDRKYIYEY